ncbi:hypothetical protein [Geodermatophilus chilensis]|uniref:hypothetical protein n=1 Tax=Geodermatophilus chilensis TaxID=2035835 RepID=UPI000C26587F|nr:hypothetical protein [Geodermatophilus chilensis]
MNAEEVTQVVRLRCGSCNSQVGAVYRVRNYHRAEPVLTPDGQQTRVTDLAEGLVLTSTWQQTETPKRERSAPSHDVEQPVQEGAHLIVWCPQHAEMQPPTPAQVTAWASEAERSGRRLVTRVLNPRPAPREPGSTP